MSQPTLTVLIPFWNRAEYLPEALQSIEKQTFKNWKVTLLDDGSKDNSMDVAEKFAMKWAGTTIMQNETNMGIGFCRNKLLASIDTPFAAFMDSDDYSEPTRFELQLREISKGFDLVQTDMMECRFGFQRCKVRRINVNAYGSGKPEDMWRNVCFASSLFKRECTKVPFDVSKKDGGEDVKWLRQLIEAGFKMGHVAQPLYKIRHHRGRITLARQRRMRGLEPFSQFKEVTK